MEFLNCNIEELKAIVWKHYSSKPSFSNYYFNDLSHLDYFENDNTLILRKKEFDFFRIYFYAKDANDLISTLKKIQGKCVINIPIKMGTCELQPFLESINFKLLSRYERWFNPETKTIGNFTGVYAEEDNCIEILQLFDENFDPRIDHIPNKEDLLSMIRQKQVLINMEGGSVIGFFIFTLGKGKCYFNFWFDKGKRGMETLNNVYFLMHQQGIKYSYLWVNSENIRVKKIHKLLGSKPDGVLDFTFFRE